MLDRMVFDSMRAVITGVLSMVSMVIGYFGLRWLGKRFFAGRYRAETAAAAVVVAFSTGANWPHSKFAGTVCTTPPYAAPAAVAPPAISSLTDVGAACASTRLTTGAGKGHFDNASVRTGAAVARAVPGVVELQAGDTLIARGWAANAELKGPAVSVCAAMDGKIVSGVKVLYGGRRPDVVAAYENAALAPTAYEISLPAVVIRPGRHRIQAAAVTADGSAALLPGDVQIAGPHASNQR